MFDFLQDIKIDDSVIVARKGGGGGGGHRKNWNPAEDLLAIRVWRDGSVYPSKALVERFDLEYHDKPAPVEETKVVVGGVGPEKWSHTGSAFDVFSSKDFPAFKAPKVFVLVNVTARAGGKADLFGSVGWADNGKVLASVLDQGATTFGKTDLIPMLKEVYGIELNEENPATDLVFVGKDGAEAMKHFVIEKGFCFVPKKLTRGDKKGTDTVVRREDPWLFILAPLKDVFPDRVEKIAPIIKREKKEKTEGANPEMQDGAKVPGSEPAVK